MTRLMFAGTLGVIFLVAGCASLQGGTRNAAQKADQLAIDVPYGITLVEDGRISDEPIFIPHEKLVLANGLTVILHQDTSDPLVHVDVTYHVGSAREDIGRSGFVHFFEHMMFQGSQNVADEEHFRLVTEAGGTMNGTTSSDRTNYFQTVPKNHLEKMLWLEADRMGFLLPAVTQEKFEIQRATVKNERAQMIDNRPYGRVSERVAQALYPEGHPYSWPVIGWTEDLDRVDVNDLKDFFLRWYGPNNATLTIGGDFDRDQTLQWIEQYFGSIPAGPAVEDMAPAPGVLEAVSRDELAAIAAGLLDTQEMVILVVGDGQSVRPQLQAAGYTIVEIDETGTRLEVVDAGENVEGRGE